MDNKAKEMMIFKKSVEFVDDGETHGMLAKFEPGTRVLKKGFQLAPRFKPLECDIILEKDVPVKMRDGVTIYTDILRPITDEKVPGIIQACRNLRVQTPHGGARRAMPFAILILEVLSIAKEMWSCWVRRKGRTATTTSSGLRNRSGATESLPSAGHPIWRYPNGS